MYALTHIRRIFRTTRVVSRAWGSRCYLTLDKKNSILLSTTWGRRALSMGKRVHMFGFTNPAAMEQIISNEGCEKIKVADPWWGVFNSCVVSAASSRHFLKRRYWRATSGRQFILRYTRWFYFRWNSQWEIWGSQDNISWNEILRENIDSIPCWRGHKAEIWDQVLLPARNAIYI